MTPFTLRHAAHLLHAGGIVAHPTEGVFGLACNPLDAVAIESLLRIKQRSAHKGLILIAADLEQLAPFIAPQPAHLEAARRDWPGAKTLIMPARPGVPPLLTGGRPTLATRVTAHTLSAALCRAFGGPLVSTSANLSGRPAALTAIAVRKQLGADVDAVLAGSLDRPGRPTPVVDPARGIVHRA